MKFVTKSAAVLAVGFLPTAGLADFTGAYVGGAVSNTSSQFEADAEDIFGSDLDLALEDSVAISALAGYQVQSGNLVYGGEIAISSTSDVSGGSFFDFEFGDDVTFDAVATDIKGRLGYVVADGFMVYGTAGLTTMTIESDGGEEDAEGFVIGAGVDYLVTENIILGAEFANRQVEGSADIFGDEVDIDLNVNAVALRASFKF